MAGIFTDNKFYYAIASAIREKLGVSQTYKPSQMPSAILDVSGIAWDRDFSSYTISSNGNYSAPSNIAFNSVCVDVPPDRIGIAHEISKNGTYSPSNSSIGFNSITVSVNKGQNVDVLESKIIQNGTYAASSGGKYSEAFEQVTISVPTYSISSLSVSSNGMYYPPEGYGFENVSIDVPVRDNMSSFYAYMDGTLSEYVGEGEFGVHFWAFYGCPNLKTVSFPDASFVGESAFALCSSLESIYFPTCATIYQSAFAECVNLESAVFPECLTISRNAFLSCKSLKYAYFPKCTSGEYSAFKYCSSLETAIIPLLPVVAQGMFANCENLSFFSAEACTKVISEGFSLCGALSDVYLPNVTSLSTWAFARTGLSKVNFPNCTALGSGAFWWCSELKSVRFSPDLSYIYQNAFKDCEKLYDISFPNVSIIGSSAFANCTALVDIEFPNVNTIRSNAFESCKALRFLSFPMAQTIESYAFRNCSGLRTVEFPSCETIAREAFESCGSLSKAIFNKCLTVGYEAFESCIKLENIEFPKVTLVSTFAFRGCDALLSVIMPECSVLGGSAFARCRHMSMASFDKCESIGDYAFYDCFLLKSIYFLGSSIPTISTSIFYDTPVGRSSSTTIYTQYAGVTTSYVLESNGYIYVKPSMLDAFKAADGWSSYADYILPYSG